jgi:hypothetical protein
MTAEYLLALTDERIEREMRELRAAERSDRLARRQGLMLAAKTAAWYLAGLALVGASFASRRAALAGYAFVAGLIVAGIGPLATWYGAWRDQQW